MNKEQAIKLKNDSETKCRELFDQLTTLQQQVSQIEVELERTRGDFRTYSKIVDEWKESEDIPEEDRHLPKTPEPSLPSKDTREKK